MENWCSYKYILVHLLFSLFFSAFYGFDNIFVSFHPNNIIFSTFWRVFKVLPKTGLEPVFIGLLRSSPGPVSVFCWSQDQTSKHYLEEAPTEMTTGLEDWKLETTEGRNILFYKGKNYIPKYIELRRDIVKTFHDHETAGHPGEIGTYNAVWQHYWWPGLRTFVKNYVQGCETCQQFKIDRSPAKSAYIPT